MIIKYNQANMLKLAAIFALALGCHGVYVPAMKYENGEIPESSRENFFSPVPFYMLYTQSNPWQPIPLSANNLNQLSNIKTIFLVHGHGGSYHTSLNPAVRIAILEAEGANVISMDWQGLAANSYNQALSQVHRVAENLREFITLISASTGTPIVSRNNIQIVGFNLGAHVAGMAARGLHFSIARITGLDPSREHWGPLSGRLNQVDADYVEIIHTDGGRRGNGIGESIGRVDFYVNGGSNQPGCYNRLCSHNRAHEVYAASIRKRLVGYRCETTSQLNLNRCRGISLQMGNTIPFKIAFGVFRSNIGRPPF